MSSIALRNVPLFHGLSAAELEHIEDCLREQSLEKGQILHAEGVGCEKIFIVREGRIKLYRMTGSGREQILEVLEAGDTCACNPGSTVWYCGSTAEAATKTKIWYLSRSRYIDLVQRNTKVAQALNQLFAERLQCLSALVEEVSLKDVKKRLIKFLLDMLNKKGKKGFENNTLFIPFTREEIAQRLGTARETVARYLTQLKEAHLIDVKPYQIVILNREGLEKLL